jgi:hypothetical protein
MATRFWSPDSGGGESVAARACASSSLLTGFALRTSASPGAVELAAKALRVSGGPTGDVTGALVATAPTFGAAAGLDPPEATAGLAVGDVCALEPPRPGASRCTLRRNFMPRKPTTKTTTPTMSGIGDTRLFPPVATGRRRTTGAATGFARSFSWRYE